MRQPQPRPVESRDILSALSLPDRPYPVQAGDLAGLVVLVPADAWSLSPRMARLDAELGPAHGVRVAVDATPLATRAQAAVSVTGGSEPQLWTFPWETLARRELAGSALAEELGPISVPLPSADPRQPAKLMARVGEEFPLKCPACGGDIRLIAFITEPAPIRKILAHLGEPLEPPPVSPARGPPTDRGELLQVHDDGDTFKRRPTNCPRSTSTRCEIGVPCRLIPECGEGLR